VWLSIFLAATDGDATSTVLPLVGAGGAGLSAVLLYLLLDEKKERRADKKTHDEAMMKMVPVLTSVAAMQDRVLQALSTQVEYHDRRPGDPEVLRHAYNELERLLDEFPPPPQHRRRSRGSE
jgi:hypothetical protein